ncbi:hypothetical protein Calkro_1249 [Caldicellulosiruptor kronotskyensis 2002]|uniref:Uncharacterized protein n=1 Tax=Caldicellulosiruptor kronotskyensis (strain DSM 18902 / VKM B-2412 / 2002) TaxID=632348 RepID=E4SBI7_CALK2|nr:hypothetical protein [Caldicellulosiruptor kronotskyensis]ADQ46110.1 hypothetical protein Calkro_1249 [Caldicellulosiruptor kronotskyensis 2002]
MVKIGVLYKSLLYKEMFKSDFVDFVKKKGKKILEIDLANEKINTEKITNLLTNFNLPFDYIIFYLDCPQNVIKYCELAVVLQNEILDKWEDIFDKHQKILIFMDNSLPMVLKNASCKVVDIGFSSQNTINITHLDYGNDNKVSISLFFQRAVETIDGNIIAEKEIKEKEDLQKEEEGISVCVISATLKSLCGLNLNV